MHSVECLGQITNGAPWDGAPLLVKLVMAHHSHGAPLVIMFQKNSKFLLLFFKLLMAHRVCGAPLLVRHY